MSTARKFPAFGETAIIVLGIAALWPWILGYRPAWYLVFLIAMALALGALAVVRFRRLRRAIEQQVSPGPSEDRTLQ